MNYWKYPVFQLQRASSQFDWCNMPDNLNYYNNPNYEKERNAIAGLLKELGDKDKLNMEYCSDGKCLSGAKSSNVRDVFVDFYNYSSDADFQRKFWHNINTWKGRIKNNLNNGWPVYYSGSGSGGHAFICDGYTSDDYFHFNWGWRNLYLDTWLTLDYIVFADNDYTSSQEAFFFFVR